MSMLDQIPGAELVSAEVETPKIELMFDAIAELRSLPKRLSTINATILEGDVLGVKGELRPEETKPNLSINCLLQHGPSLILDVIAECHERMNEIERELFL